MHALAHLGPSDAMGVEVDARCTDSADRARDSARANSGFCYSGSCFCYSCSCNSCCCYCCCAVAQPTRAHARAPHLRRRPARTIPTRVVAEESSHRRRRLAFAPVWAVHLMRDVIRGTQEA